ncbi:hypothetical protein BY458DRAFT_496397 [Sporodiniella umbellata]|nr:hypothetical protein BY458DRAFT_496397 [Sporodiniella umbellata]
MFATLELALKDDSRHKRLKVGRACHPCRMKKIKVSWTPNQTLAHIYIHTHIHIHIFFLRLV